MTAAKGSVRIGDAERDATVELLNRHFADGRLTGLEHDERTTTALTAITQPQLDVLLADLPDLRERDRPPTAPARGSFGLVRLALLAVLVVFVAMHLLPFFAVVLLFFVLSRLAFGLCRPWSRVPRAYHHQRR